MSTGSNEQHHALRERFALTVNGAVYRLILGAIVLAIVIPPQLSGYQPLWPFALGAIAVVILGIVGFTVLTLSRRKRAPQQCAAEREALALAEQAVRYWEGALTHLRNSAPSDTDAVTPGESHASLLEKATVGHANAVRVRDESQMALIQCMASGSGPVPSPDALAKLEPLKFDADPPPPAASS